MSDMNRKLALLCLGVLAGVPAVQAQLSISPLSTFGNNGWLYPNGVNGSTYSYLGTGGLERGLAFGNDQLYLVSRNGGSNVRILDPGTGSDLGSLSTAGITGGTFAISTIGVASDGAIYGANLANPLNGTTPFKVYRWADAGAVPTVAFSSTTLTTGRLGDTLDVVGSGSSTRIVAGESNNSGTGARNGYALLTTSDGSAFSGSLVNFTSVSLGAAGGTAAGDFRLGITFAGPNAVLGTQGSTGQILRDTTTAGIYLGAGVLTTTAERPMDYTVINGTPMLATVSTGDSRVRIYDATDATNLRLLATTTTTSTQANVGGTGAVAWGTVTPNVDGSASATLYAMNSNNGIQAYVVVIPEPGTLALALLGFGSFLMFRRRS